MKLRLLFLVAIVGSVCASLKPRGVSQQKLSLYRPDQPFQCFDKSKTYSFEHVNDDYCDCPDGSDEPGTSACPNGRFYCPNVGFRPKYISSMFVDDGVCDCCDGSDEQVSPGGQSPCANTCDSLGKIAREAAEQKRATMEQGHLVYKDYIQKYQSEISQKKERLKVVETERTTADEEKKRLEISKTEIEKLESEAKDKHQKEWEETKKKLEEEKQLKMSEEAFRELDLDHNGYVTIPELQTHLEFDVDGDGVVSEDEARENLEDPPQEGADHAHFSEKVWPHIKELYRKPGSQPEPIPTEEPTTTPVPSFPDEEEDEEDETKIDQKLQEFQRSPHDDIDAPRHGRHRGRPPREEPRKEEEELKMPEYPEETKKLVEAADQARNHYEEARKKYDEVDREYADLIAVTATDFGPQGEFYPLRGQCYEIEDREYVYKICPFDRASQKQKHGSHETNLGRFDSWRADGDNKYAHQSYTNGESCWNGPARSVAVRVLCGGEGKILSVSEPNRCEYAMDFATPAACNVPPPPIDHPSYWADTTHDPADL